MGVAHSTRVECKGLYSPYLQHFGPLVFFVLVPLISLVL